MFDKLWIVAGGLTSLRDRLKFVEQLATVLAGGNLTDQLQNDSFLRNRKGPAS